MQTRNTTTAFASVVTLFFAWGFVTSNNDPLIAALRAIFDLSYTEALLTQFAFFLAYAVFSLPAAALLNRYGPVRAILLALAAMVAACLMVRIATAMQVYWIVLAALFSLAAGITALQVAANPLAANLGPPERSHLRLTLAQAFNSLGVVIGVHFGTRLMLGSYLPQGPRTRLFDALQRAAALGAVDHAFTMIAAFIAVLAVFIWASRQRIESGLLVMPQDAQARVRDALKSGWAMFGAMAIFSYVGAEVSIGSVMINFLGRREIWGVPLVTAGAYLANVYWGGALIGRFLGSALLTRVSAPRLLSISAILAVLLCAVVLIADNQMSGYAALAIGLCNSIMFPTIFTITLERASVPQASASGLLCVAIVGGAFVPLVAGALADHFSLSLAFAAPALAYAVIAIFALCAARTKVESDKSRQAVVMELG